MSTPVISGELPPNLSVQNGLRPHIQFALTCDIGLLESSVVVHVDGVLAYDGSAGGLQAGYVPTVDWNIGGGFDFFGGNLNASFQQTAFLPPGSPITVRVQALDSAGMNPLDTTWVFNTSALPLSHYSINKSSDLGPTNTLFDPMRFTIIADPIAGDVIDPAMVAVRCFGIGIIDTDVLIGGVTQPGWQVATSPVLGGFLYEVFPIAPNPLHWFLGDTPSCTVAAPGVVGGASFTAFDCIAPNPGNAGTVVPAWNTEQPALAYLDLDSGLGSPILDTLTAQDNLNPPAMVYDSGAGGFQAPWAGSAANPMNPGPFPNVQDMTNRTFTTPPAGFSVSGDTVTFVQTAHVISPDTGQRYNQTGTFFWNIFLAPPPIFGKKYAIELRDPTTLVVRTSVDGVQTDCDFNLAMARVRVKGEGP